MPPLPQYALWWQLTEACSGLSRDMASVTWYMVPGHGIVEGDHTDGVYFTSSHRIVLAGDSIASGQLVRHEMLHALGATPGHPARYFQDRCGGVVDCEASCIKDGGALPAVDSLGPIIEPGELSLTVTTDPPVPIESESSWVAMTIQIQNPYDHAVRVHLTPVLGSTASETFGYNYAFCNRAGPFHLPIYDWIDGQTLVLGPRAIRRHMFDIGGWTQCRTFTPFFNTDTSSVLRIQPIPAANRARHLATSQTRG